MKGYTETPHLAEEGIVIIVSIFWAVPCGHFANQSASRKEGRMLYWGLYLASCHFACAEYWVKLINCLF